MKVVILVDSSEVALNALKFYYKNFHQKGNQVHIYHAVIPPSLPTLDISSAKFATEKIMKIMTDHNTKEQELEVNCSEIIKTFNTEDAVVYKWDYVEKASHIGEKALMYIDEIETDLVVTGSRGLRGVQKAFIGSVSDFVLKRCQCPVMIHKS